MSKIIDGYYCNICNKQYSNYNSLWTHTKKYHKPDEINETTNETKPTPSGNHNTTIQEICKSLSCKYCKKQFNHRNNRWRHEKTCKSKDSVIVIDANKIILLENKIIELENKINATTNKSINKTNKNINKTNNTNNGTINNTTTGTIINNTTNIKVSFGEEDLEKISTKDQKSILNYGYMSMIKLIEMMHLNKEYPEFNNIKIHNLKDKYAKIYDESIKNFTTVSKKDTIESLICCRTSDLKNIYDTYNKPDKKLHQCVQKLIEKFETYTPDTDDEKILGFYKNLTDEIILLIYNKTKEFSLDN